MRERFQTFTALIVKINRNIRRIKAEAMEQFDLKSPHVSCLYCLYTCGALTAKELCDLCDEDKGAVSRCVANLEKNGYVECVVTENKKYKNKLALTAKGKLVGKFILEKINIVLAEANVGIDENDRKILYNCLTIISNNLQCVSVKTDKKVDKGER